MGAADTVSSMVDSMTVGQVCRVVSAAIDDALDGEVWVRGSISSLTRSTNTYFNLIDPDSDGVTPASLSVVLFARDRARVNKMVQASGQVRVDDGVEVLIRGRVRFYPPQGRVQLIMSAIDPVYTLGHL